MTTSAGPQTDKLPPYDIAILKEDLAYADAVAPGLGPDLLRLVLTGPEAPSPFDIGSLDKGNLSGAVAPQNCKFSDPTAAGTGFDPDWNMKTR